MLKNIVDFSVRNKLIVILFTLTVVGFGLYSVFKISVGAVPDITNNQVQIITTSGNLSTQEIEQFITAPIEMEMANLPGVEEIRSVSKFGISLVTVVFSENLGTYLPRQLISEKIKTATEKIPEGYGAPEMGPITTGLGEIYQYTLDVEPDYSGVYSAMELRTIQDWIVKRRLSGIKGVVEINSWGGFLKQYEIAVNPQKLKSYNLTLMQVLNALEANNSISGGSYIEKGNQSFFIRADGGVKTKEDIEQIVIKLEDSNPVLINDIGEVNFGFANRYGAITANGKGETILGQVIMLKNANSKEVINEVKNRIAEIQGNLPKGVHITPIVDRSELVTKTTFTVAENLILGALFVMLTVILLLGNFRAALVIASNIPLALLFTISLMYIFGIDANLISLGALDFGIIIDGAVIIVEFIALRMHLLFNEIKDAKNDVRMELMDSISIDGASKMMKSALFGQIIILIVFIPILSLSGVEGKMFHPMALSFSFAIIGAMIFGLTWVPVASALFLKSGKTRLSKLSNAIMNLAYKSYFPALKWSCSHKKWVLSAAIISLAAAIFLFSKIGGEFVPTLDEGDFVIQPVLKTGTSLSKTVETTTKMENLLLSNFPEVDRIVSRIGAAEVPTDPMSMEEIDMIIKLKPRKEWVSAMSKDELAGKMKDVLSVIPGVDYEFTQPIEMRFNELITGVRSDIAVKIFGDDLDYIASKADEIRGLIQNVPGADDVILEKTEGLPQIKVSYNRSKLAHFGVDIQTINDYISTAYGGKITGVVFEGEKRFNEVVRFNKHFVRDIEDVKKLQIPLENGEQISISDLATIEYTEGPAKISHENTYRRVVVSVNVRNRDLQSVVKDIQKIIDANIVLKPGNYIEYGGQFENLENATNRLMIALPIALLLIFIFLHFAFKSFKEALLIFSAIPLATVGGVFLLWMRGLPFSVSAGVGFIALFGIAVLNGIVLIEHLKELEKEGSDSIRELIFKATKDRLRPVLLTAGAAAMGFLPMALSTGSGAEVQRPLATVVIGGLFTSTLLTMIALPLLYEIFHNIKGIRFFPFKVIRKSSLIIFFILGFSAISFGQSKSLSVSDIIRITKSNNYEIKALEENIKEKKALVKTSFNPDKLLITYGTDQNNIAANGYPLNVWGVEQNFSFPTVYTSQKKVNNLEVDLAELELKMKSQEIISAILKSCIETQYLQQKKEVYAMIDSLYKRLLKETELKYSKGEISYLDLLNFKFKQQQTFSKLNEVDLKLAYSYQNLRNLMNFDSVFYISNEFDVQDLADSNANLSLYESYISLTNKKNNSLVGFAKNQLYPDIKLHYFVGTNLFANADYYHGYQLGLSVPLFYGSYNAGIKAAKINQQKEAYLLQNQYIANKSTLMELEARKKIQWEIIESYKTSGENLVNEIFKTAFKSYSAGEIDFYRVVRSLEDAIDLKINYLDNLMLFNKTNIEIIYFTGIK